MRRLLLHSALAAAVIAGLGSCAPLPNPDVAPRDYGTEEILFQVKNFNWSDVTVYLLRGGVRTRLGVVNSMGEASFRLPAGLMGSSSDVRLLLDPIGSSVAYMTDPIFVQPGQTVEMSVENHLPLTSWAVW